MITPKKSLGQNFLRDDNVARKIVQHLHLNPADIVLEIGPGSGMLTKYLVGKCRRLIGVEIDQRAVDLLKETVGEDMEILAQDIRTVNLREVGRESATPLRVVGNIPYYITSEILFWLFEHREVVQDATLMMQIEVARRLNAKPRTKEYGILSVASQFYAEPRLLFKVSPNSFFPPPEVESAVVNLVFKKTVPDCDRELFHIVVRSTFGKRRKTLRNGLKYLGIEEAKLDKLHFDLLRRPEELSVQDFVTLTRELSSWHIAVEDERSLESKRD